MKAKIYYAVRYGRRPGICYTEMEYKKRINGFQGAWGDEFTSKQEAMDFLGVANEKELRSLEEETTEFLSCMDDVITIYVDGSYLHNHQVYGSAFVAIKDFVKVSEGYEPGRNQQAAIELESLAGELNAAMLGVRYAVKKEYKKVVLLYDNEEIKSYALSQKEPKNSFVRDYIAYFNAMRSEHNLVIEFVKVKAHKGNVWNEYADKLAKKAAQEAARLFKSATKTKNEVVDSSKEKYQQIYEAYKDCKDFRTLALRQDTKELYLARDLLKCRLQGYDVDVERMLKTTKRFPLNPNAEKTYALYKRGLSFKEIVSQSGLSTNTVLKHLAICYSHYEDITLNSFLESNKIAKPTVKQSQSPKKRRRGSKRGKSSRTHIESGRMINRGLTVTEVSIRRSIKESTVYSHLTKCISEGMKINCSNVIDKRKEEAIVQLFQEKGFKVSTIRNELPFESSYGEVMFIGAKHGYHSQASA